MVTFGVIFSASWPATGFSCKVSFFTSISVSAPCFVLFGEFTIQKVSFFSVIFFPSFLPELDTLFVVFVPNSTSFFVYCNSTWFTIPSIASCWFSFKALFTCSHSGLRLCISAHSLVPSTHLPRLSITKIPSLAKSHWNLMAPSSMPT